MSELVAEAFTNEFGQVINPGDEVVYVGSGYNHSVSVRQGKFGGVYYDTRRVYLYDEKGAYKRDERGSVMSEMKRVVSAVRIDGVKSSRWVYDYKTKSGEWKDATRCAILPLKRVYKIDTSLSALSGKSL